MAASSVHSLHDNQFWHDAKQEGQRHTAIATRQTRAPTAYRHRQIALGCALRCSPENMLKPSSEMISPPPRRAVAQNHTLQTSADIGQMHLLHNARGFQKSLRKADGVHEEGGRRKKSRTSLSIRGLRRHFSQAASLLARGARRRFVGPGKEMRTPSFNKMGL